MILDYKFILVNLILRFRFHFYLWSEIEKNSHFTEGSEN